MYDVKSDHDPGHVSVSEARVDFAELVNRVLYAGDRVRLVRHGKDVAAIVPVADLEWLERLEDEMDLRAARDALADPENATTYALEDVEAELDH
jgi:prevent-host-death family protein